MEFPQFKPDVDTSSVGPRWTQYKERFENFMIAKHQKEISKIENLVLKASFLHVVGPKVYEMYKSVAKKEDKYEEVIQKIDSFFKTQIHEEFEKFIFSRAHQEKDEPFEAFVNRLRVLGQHCGFANLDAEVKSKAIQGCIDEELQLLGITKVYTPAQFFDLGCKMESLSNKVIKCRH